MHFAGECALLCGFFLFSFFFLELINFSLFFVMYSYLNIVYCSMNCYFVIVIFNCTLSVSSPELFLLAVIMKCILIAKRNL